MTTYSVLAQDITASKLPVCYVSGWLNDMFDPSLIDYLADPSLSGYLVVPTLDKYPVDYLCYI